MVIEIQLVADDHDTTTVATTVRVDTADPRWTARLVEAITAQAGEGARRLRDQLVSQRAIPWDGDAGPAFVPLAAVVPTAESGR
jgi:hypothetical protein